MDSIKSGLTQIIYPRSYYKTPQQQQAHQAFHQTQMIWIVQRLNTLDSTISPYLMKTNPWLLVLDLIESETIPVKTTYIQSSVSYNSRLVCHKLKTMFQTNNRLFTRNNRLFLSAEAETVMISEISAVLNNFRERYTRTNQFSPYLSSQIDYNRYKTNLKVKDT